MWAPRAAAGRRTSGEGRREGGGGAGVGGVGRKKGETEWVGFLFSGENKKNLKILISKFECSEDEFSEP